MRVLLIALIFLISIHARALPNFRNTEFALSYAQNKSTFFAQEKTTLLKGVLQTTFSNTVTVNYDIFLSKNLQMINQFQSTNHLFDHGQAEFSTRHLQENDYKTGLRYLFNRSLAIGIRAGYEDEFYFDVEDNRLVNFKKEKLTYYEYHLFYALPLSENYFISVEYNQRPESNNKKITKHNNKSFKIGVHGKFRTIKLKIYYGESESEFETETLEIKNKINRTGFKFSYSF